MVRKKITDGKVIAEDVALFKLKPYTPENFAVAVNDLSLAVNNAYFRTPFQRCPDCNKGNNTIMAYFGAGGANKIGNLRSFQATIGDIIAWNSDTFHGLSVVKTKDNGIFGLETSPFYTERKEPAVVEKVLVPEKYRPLLGQMATYLTNKDSKIFVGTELVKIGESEYPVAIKEQL